jgi:hypothetical protein
LCHFSDFQQCHKAIFPTILSADRFQEYTYDGQMMGSGSFGTVYPARLLTSSPDEWKFVLKIVCPTSAAVEEDRAPTSQTARYRTFNTLREIFL